STEALIQSPVAMALTALDLRAAVAVAPASGQTVTITIRKNAVNTSITCTITGPATTCSDLNGGHATAFAAGDLISASGVTSATSGSVNAINVQIQTVTTSP